LGDQLLPAALIQVIRGELPLEFYPSILTEFKQPRKISQTQNRLPLATIEGNSRTAE
jgi:hypothetical protein